MSRATDGTGNRANSSSATSAGPDSQSKSRDYRRNDYGQGVADYGQNEFRNSSSTAIHYDPQSHSVQQMANNQPRSNEGQHADYYDRTGSRLSSSMKAYDPTVASTAGGSVQSRGSSSFEQPTSPIMTSYYPTSAGIHAQQMSPYSTPSYSQFQPAHSSIDPSSTGYHIMPTMGGVSEVSSALGGIQSVEAQMHGSAGPGVALPMMNMGSPQEQGMDPGMYYHQQQYPSTPGGNYRPHHAYYPTVTASPSGQAAGYPTMMTGMQGYHHNQYPSHTYGMQQSPYGMSVYTSPQAANAGYFPSQRPPGWTPTHWRAGNAMPNYYPYQQSLATVASPSKRAAHGASSNRSRGQLLNTNSLPMRPGSVPSTTRTTSGSVPMEGTGSKGELVGGVGGGGEEPSVETSSEKESRVPGKGLRPHYHPQQGPRSDFVLWCGNVPSDTNVEELWSFFSQLPPDVTGEEEEGEKQGQGREEKMQEIETDPAMSPSSGHGVLSVFIIARSNCAFVNYATPRHLQRAVNYFHGQTLRPADPRCPKLVCRVRKKDDEAQAGVAGQRGRGMHVAWVKEQDRTMKQKSKLTTTSTNESEGNSNIEKTTPHLDKSTTRPDPIPSSTEFTDTSSSVGDSGMAHPLSSDSSLLVSEGSLTSPDQEVVSISAHERPSFSSVSQESSSGSISYTSTNSSLFRHPAFHERFFILKSLGTKDLHRSVQIGLWSTQPHNEQVLDQAYRNSESVYLIFSANQSGGFYGYARMAGPILSNRESQQQQQQQQHQPTEVDSNINAGGSIGPLRTPLKLSDAIPEGDEAKGEGDAVSLTSLPNLETNEKSVNSLLPPQSSTLLSPGEGGILQETMLSPQQLTPAIEEESLLPSMTSNENLTWPVQKQKEKDASPEKLKRGQTLSPNTLLSRPLPEATIDAVDPTPTPSHATPASRLEVGNAEPVIQPLPQQQIGSHLPSSPTLTSKDQVEMDDQGVRRKDMISGATSIGSDGGARTGNGFSSSSQMGSLGPSDSASYPDAKLQDHLALRALIHNLRLEERESVIQAEQLEKRIKEAASGEEEGGGGGGVAAAAQAGAGSDSGHTATPRAESSDSWGKPFKVEWVKTSPLAFSQVRKLRNPWRDNRQVKVSRDGTELEPNVGRQLLKEWERVDQDNSTTTPGLTSTLLVEDDEEDEDEDR